MDNIETVEVDQQECLDDVLQSIPNAITFAMHLPTLITYVPSYSSTPAITVELSTSVIQ